TWLFEGRCRNPFGVDFHAQFARGVLERVVDGVMGAKFGIEIAQYADAQKLGHCLYSNREGKKGRLGFRFRRMVCALERLSAHTTSKLGGKHFLPDNSGYIFRIFLTGTGRRHSTQAADKSVRAT